MKWRFLKDIQDPTTLPENWYCELNKGKEIQMSPFYLFAPGVMLLTLLVEMPIFYIKFIVRL